MRLIAIPIPFLLTCAQLTLAQTQIDSVSQIKRKVFADSREYDFSYPAGNGVVVSLSSTGAKTATFKPCPKGVAGSNIEHWLRISGGTGTAEQVLITGGTCTSGAATGTLTFTTANTHTGTWKIGSATAGLQEAHWWASANDGIQIEMPCGEFNIYAPIRFGNGTSTTVSTRNYIAAQGCEGKTILVWMGPADGTIITFHGPIRAAALNNLYFIGNATASVAATAVLFKHVYDSRFTHLYAQGFKGVTFDVANYTDGVAIGYGSANVYWEDITTLDGGVSTSSGIRLGEATAGTYATYDHMFNQAFFVAGSTGTAMELRFANSIAFQKLRLQATTTALKASPPTGNTAFPNFFSCIQCRIYSGTVDSTGWTGTAGTGMTLITYSNLSPPVDPFIDVIVGGGIGSGGAEWTRDVPNTYLRPTTITDRVHLANLGSAETGVHGPLLIWRNPASTIAGEVGGLYLNISSNIGATPAANDLVGATLRVTNDGMKNSSLWGANVLVQQSVAIDSGQNALVRGMEIEVQNACTGGNFEDYPIGGTGCRANGLEIVTHSGTAHDATTGLAIFNASNTAGKRWHSGVYMNGIAQQGLWLEGGSGEYTTANILDDTQSPVAWKAKHTHTDFFNFSDVGTAPTNFVKGETGGSTIAFSSAPILVNGDGAGIHVDSDTGYVKSAKLEVRRADSAAIFWDHLLEYFSPASQYTYKLRDNAGASVFEAIRTVSGITNKFVLYQNLYPNSISRTIGDSADRYGDIYGLYFHPASLCSPDSVVGVCSSATPINLAPHLIPVSDRVTDLGSPTRYYRHLYVETIDFDTCNGTGCTGGGGGSYWSRETSLGYLYPTTASDKVRSAKGFESYSLGSTGSDAGLFVFGTTSNTWFAGIRITNVADRGIWFTEGSASEYSNALILDNTTAGTVFKVEGGAHTNFVDLYGSGVITYFINNSGPSPTFSTFLLGPSGGREALFTSAPIRVNGDGAGVHVDATTGYLKATKLEVRDPTNAGAFWDLSANAGATSQLTLRDNSGNTMVQFIRASGVTTNYSMVDSGWHPFTSGIRDLGDNATPRRWNNLHLSGSITVGGNTLTDASRNTFVNNLTIAGSCTGCPSGGATMWTDGGATTYLNNGDNLGIGTTSTSQRLGVQGDIGISGDLIPTGGNGVTDLGTASARLGSVTMDSSAIIQITDGFTQRFVLGASAGFRMRDFGGSTVFSVSPAGTMFVGLNIQTPGGFGSTDTVNVMCSTGSPGQLVFSLGVMISTTCP